MPYAKCVRSTAWLLFVFATMSTLAAREPYDVVIDLNVAMKTRDGVTLNADVYRPRDSGAFPVILRRTPYGKSPAASEGVATAARGYVYIAQDVRGRESSGGEWYPFRHEADDGYDAVEWAASLPYANGKVGLISGSYEGIVQLYAAMANPPHLVCAYTGVCPSDVYGQLVYNGGAFMLALAQAWSGALSVNELNRRTVPAADPAYWAKRLPLADFPLVKGPSVEGIGRYYRDWLDHPAFDEYWQPLSFEKNYEKIKIPIMHWGGWYDVFATGTLRNYTGLKSRAGSAAARDGQRLVMLPGGHAGFTRKIADVDFGEGSIFPLWEDAMRWFDWHLKGIDNGMAREKRVRLFVMGENVWRQEEDWPLARAVVTRYHLHSGGDANTAGGGGSLSLVPATAEVPDKFVYDPTDPVPTTGGATLGITAPPPGPADQRALGKRSDILVYTTAPFAEPLEVTGPVALEAFVSTTVEDTDLVGRIIDVGPDGRSILITEGILRLRYRDSFSRPELMVPGKVYRVRVDLWATANVFLRGHRLRLEITSSSFPRFDPHPNHGGDLSGATKPCPATTTIYHDERNPSALLLPVVPR